MGPPGRETGAGADSAANMSERKEAHSSGLKKPSRTNAPILLNRDGEGDGADCMLCKALSYVEVRNDIRLRPIVRAVWQLSGSRRTGESIHLKLRLRLERLGNVAGNPFHS